jgi:hypothetical protein
MAKKSKKGPGRGRSASEKDPATGRFKTKTTSATTTTTTVTAAPSAPAAAPAGPTVTPEQITEEISGFRKALLQTMNDLGGEQSELQDAVLDGLRQTAEVLVSENENIFGKRYDKTVDQSAAYEILESVVRLGEMAVRAKTVQEKRKILQRLQTYKKVTNKVFGTGGGRESAIAGKILEMIAKIEKPLSKESGVKAAAKEKITDFAKKIPERMAAKIPLIGGILSRSLQSRRERKEEEAEALSTLAGEISQAGRTSLYGRRGGAEIEPSPSLMGGADTTPPIPGGTTVSKIMGGGKSTGVFGGKAVVDTLTNILSQVKDIKSILVDQYDPAQEELKKEEAKREAENAKAGMFGKLKKMMGLGGGGAEVKKEGGGISGMIGSMLGGIKEYIPAVASTIAGFAPSVVGGLAAAAPVAGAVLGGAAIGLGGAYLVNKGVDTLFGTNLADKMMESDTWTFGDVERDRQRAEMDKKIETAHQAAVSSPEYTAKRATDPRQLAQLVREGKMSGTQALMELSTYESQNGAGEDTEFFKSKIMEADPTAVALPPLPPVPEQIPPVAGTIEKTTPAAAIPEASNGKASIQREIDTINEEMRKLEVVAQDPDPSNPYRTIEGQNKLNARRAELNTRRQSLYTQMYSMESGTIVPPSTPSTDVGRTTMQLDSARDAAEQAKQMDSAPAPTVNAVNAPKTTNNAITVNNNTGAGVRNNDPTLKSAERASL